MRTNLINKNNFTMMKTFNLNRTTMRVALIGLFISLGVGEMSAGDSHSKHTATLIVDTGTGNGTVYAATSEDATTGKASASFDCGSSENGQHTGNLYAHATPADGYTFKGWTKSATSSEGANTTNPLEVSFDVNKASVTETYYAHFQEKVTATITLKAAANGTYTAKVGSTTKTVSTSDQSITTEEPIEFKATPASGYKFFGWYTSSDGGTTRNYFSYSTTATPAFTTNTSVYAEFISTSVAIFIRNNDASVCYKDLNAALSGMSSGHVRLYDNGTLPAGTYTIPTGVKLYIPRADGSSPKDGDVERSQAVVSAPSAYRTLTLANGANIIVNGTGSIEVGAQIVGKAQNNSSASAGCNGAISGTYGLVVMNEGSTITLNGTSVLYAWGQITGSGRITANSGTTVYEIFQVTDWCGGSRAYACNSGATKYKMFPFSQYHIQNIEVPLRLKNGAYEKLMAAIDGNNADDIPLVGPNNSSSMFRMNSSDAYIEKSYDAVNDRQVYRTGGTASINDFSMKVVITVSTTSFILPLTNNMSVYIESGTTSITTNAIVNADARIHIAEGATLEMVSDKSLYVYDSDDWLSGFVFNGKKIAPLRYSLPYATSNGTSSGTPIRTDAKIEDATILVNGTLNMKGKLYTSSGNAKIYSTATGKVIFSNAVADANTTVYHLNTISGSNFAASVATTYNTTMYPAQLQNSAAFKTTYGADFEYLATAGVAANTTINYKNGHWGWIEIWKDYDGTVLKAVNTVAKSTNGSAPSDPTREGYSFSGWGTADVDDTNQEVTHIATYTPLATQYTITVASNGNGTVSGGGTFDEYSTTQISATANTGYHFEKWQDNNTDNPRTITVTGNAAYTATFAANTYSVRFNGNGATSGSMNNQSFTYDEAPKALTVNAFAKDGYSFDGWATSANGNVVYSDGQNVNNLSSEQNAVVDLYAKWRLYTITWRNMDGSLFETPNNPTSIEYDAKPAPPIENPTYSDNTHQLYVFTKWKAASDGHEYTTADLPNVTADETYTAQYDIVSELVVEGEQSISTETVVSTALLKVSGRLTVDATLTTDDLILEATPSSSGELVLVGESNVEAKNAYFEFSQPGGFKARTWYAVAVPWQVEANGGISAKKGDGDFALLQLGSKIDLIYYRGNIRAASGPINECWQYVEDDPSNLQIMQQGRAYMFCLYTPADIVRFARKSGTEFKTTLSVETYNSTTGNANDANWNGIANPATYHAYINANADAYKGTENAGQVYDADNKSYKVINLSTTQLLVGQPVFVQATTPNNDIHAYANKEAAYPTLAPRRAKAQSTRLTRYEIQLVANDSEKADRIIVRLDEDKEKDEYVVGKDLIKMGLSSLVPQIYINRYGSAMCINTAKPIHDKAEYPLGIFAPEAGEYDIFVAEASNEDVNIYLTYNGKAIWNLAYGPYTIALDKGTTNSYGLRLSAPAPQVTTGIEEAVVDAQGETRKVLINNHVFIIRGNNVYGIDGQLIK